VEKGSGVGQMSRKTITQEDLDRAKVEYDNMSQEDKDKLHKEWEIFQTKFRFCKHYYVIYWQHEMKMPEQLRIGHGGCKIGNYGCAFSMCDRKYEVLKLKEQEASSEE